MPLNFGSKPVPQPGGGMGVGSSWYESDRDGKNLRKLTDDNLRVRDVHHSTHYGLIVWCDLGDSLPRWICCEFVKESPKK